MITTIYYIASIASIFLFVISVQFKDKKNILLSQAFASMCYFTVYFIEHAYSGCVIELIEQSKDFVFYGYDNKKKKIPLFILILFLVLLIVASIITFDGLLSLLPLIINILYFVSSYFKNPVYIRSVMIVNAILWICYNAYVGAYIIIIGNVLEIISAIISLFRYDIKKTKKNKKKKHTK